MDGDRSHLKRKEPAEASEPRLLSGNTNFTEQAESSNAQSINEAGSSLGGPNQQNQVHPALGFAMLAGQSNPWRNIRPRTSGTSSGSTDHLQSTTATTSQSHFTLTGGPLPLQQNGGYSSFFSTLQSVAPDPLRATMLAEVQNFFMELTDGLPNHGEGVEAELDLDLPEWEEEPDLHDDLRLDIDDMSYEELLALEEQIGTVGTGLTEDAINRQMRRYVYSQLNRAGPQIEEGSCCICLEGFQDGDLVGRLDCGHEYHYDCIKEWLLEKNLCPVCKSAGISG